MKKLLPWWAKMPIKMIWSRLPLQYKFWQKVGVFRHGFMDNPEYVSSVFSTHWSRAQFARKQSDWHAMELGCGDSLASCQIANAYNVKKCYLVDVSRFATMDMAFYKALAARLRREGITVPDIERCGSVPEMLELLNTEYLTEGLNSLKIIPSGSVDFIWSQAVLEHIRRNEFLETMKELRRIVRHDGVISHRIDLRDHLQEALNNLRFPERVWESPFMAGSGFYTNRIRYGEMLDIMRQADFDVKVVRVDRWEKLPTPREKMDPQFQPLPEQDLLVSGFDVVLNPI